MLYIYVLYWSYGNLKATIISYILLLQMHFCSFLYFIMLIYEYLQLAIALDYNITDKYKGYPETSHRLYLSPFEMAHNPEMFIVHL